MNLSKQAYLQAQKDIREELAKEGRVYIDVSLKALQAFQESLQGLDFIFSSRHSWQLARGANGKYKPISRINRWI